MKNWALQTGKTGREDEATRVHSDRTRSLIRSTPLLLALLLNACFSLQVEDWPDNIPPSRLFVRAWQEDPANQLVQPMDEYLYWVKSFYVGTVVYPRGWLDIKSELLTLTNNDEQSSLAREIDSLGITIGAEWAKLNEGRLIDNRMLALWGSVLQLSLAENKERQAIDFIASDVARLLAGEIQKEGVVELRYADALGYELFGDFGDF
ncbi:MAG: hypothetical protein O2948_00080 [Proteobacteria bacterium]|nr:hypothetical protein [Pseudomonadota bacterium]MDA0928667.1 hypothetical protein [Pseudomonadota bacterium]